MINYIDDLPLPNHLITKKLKELLSPIDNTPFNNIEIASVYEITSLFVRYSLTKIAKEYIALQKEIKNAPDTKTVNKMEKFIKNIKKN